MERWAGKASGKEAEFRIRNLESRSYLNFAPFVNFCLKFVWRLGVLGRRLVRHSLGGGGRLGEVFLA
jgi:hypothetical protein